MEKSALTLEAELRVIRQYKVVVYMAPYGKERPKIRMFRNKSNSVTRPDGVVLPMGNLRAYGYTPKNTVVSEKTLRVAVLKQLPKNFEPITGAVRITTWFYLPVPTSMSKKKRLTALPTTKPDIDNLEKLMFDGLQEIKKEFFQGVWKADSQIIASHSFKWYSFEEEPRYEILIEEVERINGDQKA